jgi:hypothetical protein
MCEFLLTIIFIFLVLKCFEIKIKGKCCLTDWKKLALACYIGLILFSLYFMAHEYYLEFLKDK